MRAGKLRSLIDIERAVTSRDSRGGVTKTWTAIMGNVPAAFESLYGREYYAAKQLQDDVEVKVTIRYCRNVDTTCRIKYGGVYYNILSVIDVGSRHREIQLMCRTMIDGS